MPRYFFHLRDGTDTLIDAEGADLGNLDEARIAAFANARNIISHDALDGRIDLTQRIEVFDEAGTFVCSVKFADAVDVVWDGRDPPISH